MKKTLALLLALLMVLLSLSATLASASATESFSVKGITFGDSKDTVEKALPGGEMFGNEYIADITLGDEPGSIRVELQGGKTVSRIRYRFYNGTVDHRLNNMMGKKDSYKGADSEEEFYALYSTFYSSLVEKYGEPLKNPMGETYFVFDTDTVEFIYRDANNVLTQYDEWVVQYDDYNLKIDLLLAGGYDGGYYYGTVWVVYNKFTEEDIATQQEKLEKEMQQELEKKEDIKNSL